MIVDRKVMALIYKAGIRGYLLVEWTLDHATQGDAMISLCTCGTKRVWKSYLYFTA